MVGIHAFVMETIVVQINDQKAYKLFEDLEALNILKVLKKSSYDSQKLSDKYSGKLPEEVAEELQDYVTKSRSEWKDPT